jgi:hypothetical protein
MTCPNESFTRTQWVRRKKFKDVLETFKRPQFFQSDEVY